MACHRSIAEAVDAVYIEVDRDVAISDACFYVSTYSVGTIILATAACLIVFLSIIGDANLCIILCSLESFCTIIHEYLRHFDYDISICHTFDGGDILL